MTDAEQLLTRRQAAERFRVTTRTLDRWRRCGLLKSVVVGRVVRFRPEDLSDVVRRALTCKAGRHAPAKSLSPLVPNCTESRLTMYKAIARAPDGWGK